MNELMAGLANRDEVTKRVRATVFYLLNVVRVQTVFPSFIAPATKALPILRRL